MESLEEMRRMSAECLARQMRELGPELTGNEVISLASSYPVLFVDCADLDDSLARIGDALRAGTAGVA